MTRVSGATCGFCGESLTQRASELAVETCVACQVSPPEFTRAAAYGAYDGELRELIHLLKYEQVAPAAPVLGQMLAEAIQKLELNSGPILVIPVPLHRSRRRQRGFNQAELILRSALKVDGIPQAQVATDLLDRTRPTVSQIGLTRPQRAENMRGAFRVEHPNRVEGQQVLLVDDVLTTGTTANECARVLRRAGADKVWVATVARTLKENAGKVGLDSDSRKSVDGELFGSADAAKVS